MIAPPLQGRRVLDLTRMLPGNVCTLTLAMLGADVIKIEDRQAGDYQRTFGRQVDGAGASHHLFNRGKRSLCLDLKDDVDRDVFRRLVQHSDALVESFRPGVLERLGYSPPALHEINPGLVITRITGFGLSGPLAATAGHDINYMAFSGLLERLGPVSGDPVTPPVPFADVMGGGFLAALLTVAYLHGVSQGHRGVVVDASMTDAIALMPNMVIADLLGGAHPAGRGRTQMGGGLACYSVYPVKDGYVAVGALETRFWSELCQVAGIEDSGDDHLAPERQDPLRAQLTAFFQGHTRAEIEGLFTGRDACVTPVLSYEEMLATPHAAAREYVEVGTPAPLPILAFPAMIDGERLSSPLAAPRQGEHSAEILDELAELEGARSPGAPRPFG